MGMSSLTLQKTPAILKCIVTEIWTELNSNFKSVFLAKTSKMLDLIFDFSLHNFN